MSGLLTSLTFLATLGAGLVAGIFFAFSTFVMAALGRIPANEGVAAMQAINVTVMNPFFFVAFFGTALVAIVVAVLALFDWQGVRSLLIVVGALLYVIGTVGVTIAFNVPLNDALAPLPPASAEAAELWGRYLVTWTNWNHVRTVAPLLAAAAFLKALV